MPGSWHLHQGSSQTARSRLPQQAQHTDEFAAVLWRLHPIERLPLFIVRRHNAFIYNVAAADLPTRRWPARWPAQAGAGRQGAGNKWGSSAEPVGGTALADARPCRAGERPAAVAAGCSSVGCFQVWLTLQPSSCTLCALLPQVTHVQPDSSSAGFAVIRDDLTHPLIGGNKWRKLDGLWPQLEQVFGPLLLLQQGLYAAVLALQGWQLGIGGCPSGRLQQPLRLFGPCCELR